MISHTQSEASTPIHNDNNNSVSDIIINQTETELEPGQVRDHSRLICQTVC